ncbi:DUF393 domain-containing protein [Virgibacillus phasianinus]|uniref:DUF393 domain-containing protein n=1 Tax=Virgibacillus phasianinus TaxID=2017483 RepID=A0A220U767_9BACI|nr:DUF393 domain-containing protein [Virgibacillus phasianinus]ASK63812.1 DUF393 domain-containing protein [Virgibacillus phasianinus]
MKYTVFYDAECPLCSSVKIVMKKLDWFHKINWIPVQKIENDERYRFLQNRDIYDQIHMIADNGKVYSGIYTVRKLLTLLALTFPISWGLYLPYMDKIFGALYTWISKNRYKWFGRKQSVSYA